MDAKESTSFLGDLEKFRYVKSTSEEQMSGTTESTLDMSDDRSMTPPIPGCHEVNESQRENIKKTQSKNESTENRLTDSETSPLVQRKKSGMKRIIVTDSGDESEGEKDDLSRKVHISCFTKRRKATTKQGFPPVTGDLFTNRELGLKTLREAFPKMDLMEVQDVLMNCDWNAMKAFHVIQDGCPIKLCAHFPEHAEFSQPGSPLSPTKLSEEMEDEHPFRQVKEDHELNDKLHLASSEGETATNRDFELERTPSPEFLVSKRKTQVLSSSDDEDSNLNGVMNNDTKNDRSIDMNGTLDWNSIPLHRKKTHELSDDDDITILENKVVHGGNESTSGQVRHFPNKGKQKTVNKTKKVKPRKRRKDVGRDDDDDDEAGNYDNEVYNSDDSDTNEVTTSPARLAVCNFFQEATDLEILSVPMCSKKKLDAIIRNRPYSSWQNLVTKFQNDRLLSTELLNGASEVIQMREVMTKLLNRCERFTSEMEKLLSGMLNDQKPKHKGAILEQPSNLNKSLTLAPYQMFGLNWMYLMHKQELNGILADEMGLGKTVQAIAFLAHLMEIKVSGPHLIIVPASTLSNWHREIETWCETMSVVIYRGSQNDRRELRLQLVNKEIEDYQVLLTTYNMVVSSPEDRNLFRKLGFNYVIFDEAHMLKNMSSIRYKHLMKIKARRRLCLTGTPLQNNLVELMSLLIFVMPGMFHGKIEQVKKMFTSACKSEEGKSHHEKERIEHAKRIMKPFVLRRLKADVLKQIPAKVDEIKYCALTESQQKLYDEMISQLSGQVENRKSMAKSERMTGVVMLMELRKLSNHPLLRRYIFVDSKLKQMANLMLTEPTHKDANPDYVFEDMKVMSDYELHKLCQNYKSLEPFELKVEDILNSGKFVVLDEMLSSWKNEGERVLLFSQFTMMLDILEQYMAIRGHCFLRLDGSTAVEDRQDLIDKFNNDKAVFIFLLSTKAGGLGINLTAANKVVLHDIDYNPYNDKQAEDRCHRIGQTKEVTIVRLITKGTIEEGMLKCAQDKLQLGRDLTSEDNEEDSKNIANNLLRSHLHLQS